MSGQARRHPVAARCCEPMTKPLPLFTFVAFGLTASCGRVSFASTDPGTTEANITRVTTGLLEHSQFTRRTFDVALATTFLDRYLDALDGTRSLFLASDATQLTADPANVARETRAGDTHIAHVIYARFLERLADRTTYMTQALKTSSFDFTGHAVYTYDRTDAARPRDLATEHALWQSQLEADYLQEKLGDKSPTQIVRTLNHRYAQQLRAMQDLHPDEVVELYLDTLAHVYDPHSDYLGHEQSETFSIAMNLSLAGIGATLESSEDGCTIRALVPGSPAARSGALHPGDRIVAVAQGDQDAVDITDLPITRIVELVRGVKGSTVRLHIVPAGAPVGAAARTVAIVREDVKLADQQAKASIIDLSIGPTKRRIGVIDLPSFYAGMAAGSPRSATADVSRLLTKLEHEHVEGIVLDLRHNGGGSLGEAVSLTGLFIPQGPIVQTRDPAGKIDVEADTDPATQYAGPLVLLTSRYSASATEILAGALQDYGRAVVVGDTATFGKGTVQNLMPLEQVMASVGLSHGYDPGLLKVTTSKFYRPSGASTQLHGVASDIVLPTVSDVSGVNEAMLKAPLPWDTVPAVSYHSLDLVAPYLASLRANVTRRIATDPALIDLAGDARQFAHRLATKTISLNEAERRRELVAIKARASTRKLATRSPTYTVTLENLGAPELIAAKPTTPEMIDDEVVLDQAEHVLADYVALSDLATSAPTAGI